MGKINQKHRISSEDAMRLVAEGKPLKTFLITGKFDLTRTYIDIHLKQPLTIRNCHIEELYAWGVTFDEEVILENTIFDKFSFDSCFFEKNLEIGGCTFNGSIRDNGDIYIGYHQNSSDFICKNNVFKGFVNFFDYYFGGNVVVKGNDFQKGSCLLGNQGQPYVNSFKNAPEIEDNKGQLNLDCEGGVEIEAHSH